MSDSSLTTSVIERYHTAGVALDRAIPTTCLQETNDIQESY